MLDARNSLLHKPNGDITTNPWSDDDDDLALIPSRLPTTPPRRRRSLGNHGSARSSPMGMSTSSSPSPSIESGLRSRKQSLHSHRRTLTVDGSLSLPTHPLQSPLPSKTNHPATALVDGAITRPALKRRLGSECDFHDDSERGSSEGDNWTTQDGEQTGNTANEAEIMVFVHEVTRTDSIAGVALKYGITVSDLRRVNHLWASDPVHLRNVLYIPLHLSTRKDLYCHTNKDDDRMSIDRETPAESSTQAQSRSRSSVFIQRIPVSQLSFFPPSSQPTQSVLPSASAYNWPAIASSPYSFAPISIPTVSDLNGSNSQENVDSLAPSLAPATNSLSTLLQALPLPLSRSRRSRVRRYSYSLLGLSRLSLDSGETSRSTSSTNASETSSDQEHEMDILRSSRASSPNRNRSQSRKRTFPGGQGRGSATSRSNRALANKIDENGSVNGGGNVDVINAKRTSTASVETLRKGRKTYESYDREGDVDSATDVLLVPLQTEQLKPSPQMELPEALRRATGGR